jgi:hypothetical protein
MLIFSTSTCRYYTINSAFAFKLASLVSRMALAYYQLRLHPPQDCVRLCKYFSTCNCLLSLSLYCSLSLSLSLARTSSCRQSTIHTYIHACIHIYDSYMPYSEESTVRAQRTGTTIKQRKNETNQPSISPETIFYDIHVYMRDGAVGAFMHARSSLLKHKHCNTRNSALSRTMPRARQGNAPLRMIHRNNPTSYRCIMTLCEVLHDSACAGGEKRPKKHYWKTSVRRLASHAAC